MNAQHSPNRSPSPFSIVSEKDSSYTADSIGSSESGKSAHPDDLPRRFEITTEGESPQIFSVVNEDELKDLLAIARQCKAQAKLVADSLLQLGPDRITEANAAYGLERQMADLQEHIRNLVE